MIVFATAVSDSAVYEGVALRGIRRVAESDSRVLTRVGHDTIQRPYNEMMDEAAALPDLEALVLLHQDLELLDDSLPRRLRRAFRDPRVGLLGVLGGRLSKLHCWLSPDRAFGFAIGPNPRPLADPRISVGPHEVDGVDGALIAAAPWVVRSVRFDEQGAGRFHGYDIDLGLRVKARGGTLICEDVPCRHHTVLKGDFDAQRDAGVELARKWDPAMRPREWAAAFQL